ncbi:hypothetical protein [Myroides pelagicus]|uniref:Uncharacterized protein n=1 Tax=Myroides pelagicus TaxID=270914 RepID=A0A7K1GLD9_9FLAO|nr:hypothetical protein [Myroides pelagicus]MEC4115111.1 hypothetical protein [Myroides pelagicus]MTH29636.1 hypothetical protein [Myroides pelagicus]
MVCSNLPWVFSKKLYVDPSTFHSELEKCYQSIATNKNLSLTNDQAIINYPEIIVQYQAWITTLDDLLACEDLLDGEDITEEDPDDENGCYLVEIQATLTAANLQYFTIGELLFKIHNLLSNKNLNEVNTFDSISLGEVDEIPIYYLNCK